MNHTNGLRRVLRTGGDEIDLRFLSQKQKLREYVANPKNKWNFTIKLEECMHPTVICKIHSLRPYIFQCLQAGNQIFQNINSRFFNSNL